MDNIIKIQKGGIEAVVIEPNLVVSFRVAENAFIRVSITPDGQLYINGSWGSLFIRPDSGNSCFVSMLPIGAYLESQAVPVGPKGEDIYESGS